MASSFTQTKKRIGHAAMEVFLVINGFELNANVDEQEEFILRTAAGDVSREEFLKWVRQHITKC